MSKSGDVPQEEIGRILGITGARVGQIERAAFAKLRHLVLETDEFPLLRAELAGAFISPEEEARIRERRIACDRRERDRIAARERRARKREEGGEARR